MNTTYADAIILLFRPQCHTKNLVDDDDDDNRNENIIINVVWPIHNEPNDTLMIIHR